MLLSQLSQVELKGMEGKLSQRNLKSFIIAFEEKRPMPDAVQQELWPDTSLMRPSPKIVVLLLIGGRKSLGGQGLNAPPKKNMKQMKLRHV